MARPRKVPSLSPGQASYVLERLRRAGQVTVAQIRGYVADMGREIRDLEERLRRLRDAAGAAVAERGSTQVGNGSSAALRRSNRGRAMSRPKLVRSVTTTPDAAQTAVPSPAAAAQAAPKRRKRRFTVTPAVLASREIQGRYLPLLNKFTGKRRAQFAKTAKEKGREAAIKEMEAALKR